MTGQATSTWQNALLAAVVHILSPLGTDGIWLRSRAGMVRDQWLREFQALLPPDTPLRRVPAQITDSRLLGGLDLAATLQAGRPVAEKGLLAEANGGFILLAMAERLEPATAAKIASVMDRGCVTTERDGLTIMNTSRHGVVALDEGIDDEKPPLALTERLGLVIDLNGLSHKDIHPHEWRAADLAEARQRLPDIIVSEAIISALANAGQAMGIPSLRAGMHAVQAARALAALAGRDTASDDDAASAAMLVLAPRATQIPQMESEEADAQEEPRQDSDNAPQPERSESDQQENGQPKDIPPLDDIVLDAALASIPADLLAALKKAGDKGLMRSAGKAGAFQKKATRGRVVGSRPGDIKGTARLDVISTLRSAAPWQKLRRAQSSANSGILVRNEDFRISTYRQRSQTSTIFVVDASGSAALQRLAEAKGAVRLLLAECYIRRDEVALISFRGQSAEVLMPPTRALVRAQRALAALPGGGGTPVALGIDAAATLAASVQRNGHTASLVFMTDGRANICRDGSAGRTEAQEEARAAARALAALRINSIFIDTSPKPQPLAAELAELMGARYVPLPQANAQRVAQAVSMLQPSRDGPYPVRGAA